MLKSVRGAAALLILASSFDPGSAGAEPTPPTSEELSQASAEARRVIEAAHLQNLFDNATGFSRVGEVRHRASGMVCFFRAGDDNRLVYVGDSRLWREEVRCDRAFPGRIERTFAARVPRDFSPSQATDALLASARSELGEIKPFRDRDPRSVEVIPDPRHHAEVYALRFVVAGAPADRFVRISLIRRGDWVIGDRVVGPIDQASAVDLMGQDAMNFEIPGYW